MPWAQVPLPQIQNFNFAPAVKWRPLFLMEMVLKKVWKKNTVEPPLRLPIKWSGDVPSPPPFPLKIVVAYM